MLRAAGVESHNQRYFRFVVSILSYHQAMFPCLYQQFPFIFPSEAVLEKFASPQNPDLMPPPSSLLMDTMFYLIKKVRP